MKYTYVPRGVCSRLIELEIDDDIITACKFMGGCSGNTQGVSRLVIGMDAYDAIDKLKGINCGSKGTSCPDQLAIAIEQAVNS